MCLYMCTLEHRTILSVIPQLPYTLSFIVFGVEVYRLAGTGQLDHVGWPGMVSKPERSPISPSPSLGLQTLTSTPGLFLWLLAMESQVFLLAKQRFYQMKHVPSDHLLIVFIQNISKSLKLQRGLQHALIHAQWVGQGKHRCFWCSFQDYRMQRYHENECLNFQTQLYPTNIDLLYEQIAHIPPPSLSVCVHLYTSVLNGQF